jgi:hypothetical protein
MSFMYILSVLIYSSNRKKGPPRRLCDEWGPGTDYPARNTFTIAGIGLEIY